MVWQTKTLDTLCNDYKFLTLNDNGEGENRDIPGQQTGLAHFAFVAQNLDAVVCTLAKAGFTPSKDDAERLFRKNVYFNAIHGEEGK